MVVTVNTVAVSALTEISIRCKPFSVPRPRFAVDRDREHSNGNLARSTALFDDAGVVRTAPDVTGAHRELHLAVIQKFGHR